MAHTVRGGPRRTEHSGVPGALRAACLMWLAAVGAGVAESVIGASGVLAEEGFSAGLAANIAVRVAVYSAATVLVLFLYRRRPWARTALAVLLGCVGLATLVAPLASWFAAGGDAGAAPAAADGADLAYYAVRAVHIAAVLGAMAAMFLPASGAALRRR